MRFNHSLGSLGYDSLAVKFPDTDSKHVRLYDAHLQNKRAPGPATHLLCSRDNAHPEPCSVGKLVVARTEEAYDEKDRGNRKLRLPPENGRAAYRCSEVLAL